MSTFLPALLGDQPADILTRAVVGTPLEKTLTTRALISWISVVGGTYDGCLPGTDRLVKFEREGLVYRGVIGDQPFTDLTTPGLLKHLTDVLMVDDSLPPEEGDVAKFCRSLDGMVRAAWTLEKTSKNVKQKRAEITRAQADQRRERYARSLGLEPKRAASPQPAVKHPSSFEWYHQDSAPQSMVGRFDVGLHKAVRKPKTKVSRPPVWDPGFSPHSWLPIHSLMPTEDPRLRPDPSDPTGKNMLGIKREKVEGIKERIRAGQSLPPIHADHHGNILDGHHRFRAATELDLDDVPVKGANHPLSYDYEKTEMAPTFVAPRKADQPTPPVGPKQPRQPRAPKPPGDDDVR